MLSIDTSLSTLDFDRLSKEHRTEIEDFLAITSQLSREPREWMGWINLHEDEETIRSIEQYSGKVLASERYKNLVVLGIGGSALGSQALMHALLSPRWNEWSEEERKGGLRYYFLDNVDPDWTESILSTLKYSETLFCVITKSGSTAETIGAFLRVYERLRDELGEEWRNHVVAVTDPAKGPLREFVDEEKLVSFPVPPDVGGRFSAFSAVGLLPLALTGVDIRQLMGGVQCAYEELCKITRIEKNPAVLLALALVEAQGSLARPINPIMPYSTRLARVADWYVQLVAESLGKTREIGLTPIKAVGATDQHSQLQLFSDGPADKFLFFVKLTNFEHEGQLPSEVPPGFDKLAGESIRKLIHAEGKATAKALAKKGVPSLTILLDKLEPASLAYLMYTFELMTALSGKLLGIDPFNQPGVELSKKYTYAILGKTGYEQYLPEMGE